MDYLLARISTRKKDNLRQVLSDTTVYEIPDLTITHEYDDELKLLEGEWFCIENFSIQSYKLDWMIVNPFSPINYSQIRSDEYGSIKYLVSYQDSEYFLFQRNYDVKAYVNKKILNLIDDNNPPTLTDNPQVVFINKIPDAIYKKSVDKFYFRDLTTIKPLFPGIEILFNQATDEETTNFLQTPLIKIVGGFNRDLVKVPNRRKIRHASEVYQSFTADERHDVKEYIKEYCTTLTFSEEDEAFEISNDEELKNLINGIEQRFYTTKIRPEKRVANSVSHID